MFIFSIVAAFLSAYTYQTKQPFKDASGNMFAVAGSYIILMVSLSTLVIKLDSTYADSHVLNALQIFDKKRQVLAEAKRRVCEFARR